MNPFKIGDRVCCVEAYWSALTAGQTYTVSRLIPPPDADLPHRINVREVDDHLGHDVTRFVLASRLSPPPMKAPPLFKIGAIVRCVDAPPPVPLRTGHLYTVVSAEDVGKCSRHLIDYVCVRDQDGHATGGWDLDRFALVRNAPKAPDYAAELADLRRLNDNQRGIIETLKKTVRVLEVSLKAAHTISDHLRTCREVAEKDLADARRVRDSTIQATRDLQAQRDAAVSALANMRAAVRTLTGS